MATLDAFPEYFVDPATRLRPSTEREFTALVGLFHQRGAVRWDAVELYHPTLEASGQNAASLFNAAGVMCAEYPLFAQGIDEVNFWGDMRVDLAFFSRELAFAVFVECKLAGRFTSGGTDPDTGQLGRQAEFLRTCKFSQPHLVLLCGRQEATELGYAETLRVAITHRERQRRIHAYVMYLEELANAVQRLAV